MIGWRISIGLAALAASGVVALAQTPVLGDIEAPYAAVQSSVHMAGQIYGPGAVAYGPAGTPLVVRGTDLGDTGTVQFIAYKNGVVDTNVSPVVASPTQWTSTMIFVPVPSGSYSGMVQVTVEGKTSNLLPFIVTSGVYAGSCPSGPGTTQLQINTAALQDGAVGQTYSATLNATGGTQSYMWSVASGTLPSGLSLNASTGTISGTPTAAVSADAVTFEVTDSSSPQHQTDQTVLDLTIEPQQMNAATVYNYTANYDGNGNVSSYGDSIDNGAGSIMGSWTLAYDAFNRLQAGNVTTGAWAGQNLCWAYDSFGNRTAQSAMQTTACPAATSESALTPTASYNGNNWVTWVQNVAPSGYTYDAAGDVIYDGASYYAYDAEGRVCVVQNYPQSGGTVATGYLYDADGVRVAKGSVTTSPNFLTQPPSCDPTQNGFQLTQSYVLGPSGKELSMLDGNNTWQRTNVFVAGQLMGTYDAAGLHFHLEDPLGTRRMQLSGNTGQVGQPETDIQNWPYGDELYSYPDQNASQTADDSTPLHFTEKERDAESQNDYFIARYYGSNSGRFISPDDGSDQDPSDPQSWDLYSYVRNNPLINTDPDGHGCGASSLKRFYNGKLDQSSSETDSSDCQNGLNALQQMVYEQLQNAGHIASQAGQQAWHYLGTTNWNCVAHDTGVGMTTGAVAATATSAVGLLTGPGDLVIAPSAYVGETGYGAAAGFTAGLSLCGGSFMASGVGSGGGGGGGSAQAKKLTPREIAKLKQNHIDPEMLKEEIGTTRSSQSDLYKLPNGDIVVKGKGGIGPGEPTGININKL